MKLPIDCLTENSIKKVKIASKKTNTNTITLSECEFLCITYCITLYIERSEKVSFEM
jgi:hypothetical protein